MKWSPFNALRLLVMASIPALLLSACGERDGAAGDPSGDDALAGSALRDDLAVDPDLAGGNLANSAAAVTGGSAALPPAALTPQALAMARAEMVQLLGGPGNLRKAPEAREVAGTLPPEAALSAAARAAAAPGGNVNCADKADYSMAWAARLPESFPVIPQGATQEAAGTDEGACALRVVNFLTALPVETVMDFYYTRAVGAGYSTQRVREGAEEVLGGTKGQASYIVYARKLASGGTDVDLITSGG